MSDITPGSSFQSGQQITATDLNNLVGNASISSAVIDNTHLKQSSLADSIFNFNVIADANVSDNDYFLIWSATDSAFRRVSKGTINSQNNVNVGGTTIDTSGNLNITTGDLDLGTGSFTSPQLVLSGITASIPTGKSILFSDSLSNDHVQISKESSNPGLKIFNPLNDGSTSINCYGSLNAIAPITTSDNGVLKISATDSTGAFKTWNFSSINNANQLQITSSQSGTGTMLVGGDLATTGNMSCVALTQTSDRNLKDNIEDLTDAERKVAVRLKSLVKKFQLVSEIEQGNPKFHIGVIAQDIQSAFSEEGLDCNDYAIIDTSGDNLGVRYTQLLAFIISAM